jgi:hypothetical protein
MKKIKIIAGIAWAIAGLLVIMVLFPGLNSFSASAAKLPFMKINPNYTGGEVMHQLVSASCTLDIRKPVFDGLLGERKKGFVQLDWRGGVPENIADTIDYDLDGVSDFYVRIDRKTNKSEIEIFNNKVTGFSVSTPTSYGWASRVELKK